MVKITIIIIDITQRSKQIKKDLEAAGHSVHIVKSIEKAKEQIDELIEIPPKDLMLIWHISSSFYKQREFRRR